MLRPSVRANGRQAPRAPEYTRPGSAGAPEPSELFRSPDHALCNANRGAPPLPSTRIPGQAARHRRSSNPLADLLASVREDRTLSSQAFGGDHFALLATGHGTARHGPVQSNGMCLLEFVVHWNL